MFYQADTRFKSEPDMNSPSNFHGSDAQMNESSEKGSGLSVIFKPVIEKWACHGYLVNAPLIGIVGIPAPHIVVKALTEPLTVPDAGFSEIDM